MPRTAIRRFDARLAAVLAAVAVMYLLPLLMVVYGAFRTKPPGQGGTFSVEAFSRAFADADTYTTLAHSLVLAFGVALGATLIAAVLAWIVSRTDARTRRLVTPLMLVVLATPPIFFAISWSLLGTPRFGLVNQALGAIGLPDTLLDVSGGTGVWFVLTLKVASLSYFMVIGPFLSMDPRLEEASLISGASRSRTFLFVNIPIMAPALLGAFIVNFIIGLVALDVPLIIGRPSGYQVFATQVFSMIYDFTPPDYAGASALSLVIITVVVLLAMAKWRLLDRRQFATQTGKAAVAKPWTMGRAVWLCEAFVVGYALLAVVLPVTQMFLGSLQPIFGMKGHYSLDNYRDLLADPTVIPVVRNTLLLAGVGGLIVVAVVFALGMVGRHGTRRVRRVLELATWLPWALHGIVLGLALVWAFLAIPFLRGLFGTVWILLIALVIAATPIASRTVDAALAQIAPELEESARVSGARSLRSSVGIVGRLVLPTCLAAWLVAAIQIAGNLEVPVLLSLPSNQTIAVLVYQLNSSGQTVQATALLCLGLFFLLVTAAVLAVATYCVRAVARKRSREPAAVPRDLPAVKKVPEVAQWGR